MPYCASQPVRSWRRVSFSAATYSACDWPCVRSSPNQSGLSRRNVRTSTACAAARRGGELVHDLAQRDAALVALHDLSGPVHDGRPPDPLPRHTGTCTHRAAAGPTVEADLSHGYRVERGVAVRDGLAHQG